MEYLVPQKEMFETTKTLDTLRDDTYFKDEKGQLQWPEAFEHVFNEGKRFDRRAEKNDDHRVKFRRSTRFTRPSNISSGHASLGRHHLVKSSLTPIQQKSPSSVLCAGICDVA